MASASLRIDEFLLTRRRKCHGLSPELEKSFRMELDFEEGERIRTQRPILRGASRFASHVISETCESVGLFSDPRADWRAREALHLQPPVLKIFRDRSEPDPVLASTHDRSYRLLRAIRRPVGLRASKSVGELSLALAASAILFTQATAFAQTAGGRRKAELDHHRCQQFSLGSGSKDK